MTRQIVTKDNCKYGTLSFYDDDKWIGRSLALYGEYSEYEVEVFKKCLRPGGVALELGANIGSLTVPMAKIVGETGKVYAFEPGFDTIRLLRKNVEQNDLSDIVEIIPMAASDKSEILPIVYNPNPNYPKVTIDGDNPHTRGNKPDAYIQAITVDSLNIRRLDFAKIDVDGCEQFAIEGMRETIMRCRPFIFIENEIPDKAEKLTSTLIDMGYRAYWYRPPLYSFTNYAGELHNIFPGTVALMQIYVPEELDHEVKGCDEVSDIRLADPNDPDVFNREIVRYERISQRFPDNLGVKLIVAHYLNLMGRNEESAAKIKEILAVDPDHVPTLAIEGLHMLQAGNYKEGWQRYELRYKQKNTAHFGGNRDHRDIPQWDGQPTDEPILIWAEQGFGDTIMFSRFYKYVRDLCPNAILEVQPHVYELLETSGIAKPGTLFRQDRALPFLKVEFKAQCSLPSLPAALHDDGSMIEVRHRTTLEIQNAYLFADAALTSKWRAIVGDRKIGVCSQGSPRSERPYTRDLPVEFLPPLGLKFGPFFSLNDEGQFESYAATAAAIMALDLVITVDTSIAHLAGALGKEVWLLLAFDPDFRWGLTGTTTPWYPSMRIFRQPKLRDWPSVMTEVENELKQRQLRIAA
jgi:FkbM family methyltransferase